MDESGPLLGSMLTGAGYEVVEQLLLPDEPERLKAELIRLADGRQCALVLTTGGTGCSRYDMTPEATEAVINRLVPGIPEAMRSANNVRTPLAALSRGIAGLRGSTLIVNLPGSAGGAAASLSAVMPALKLAVESLSRRRPRTAE